MPNNDMLVNIEYLRERANVSYEEAEKLLEQYDGNVMRALVELEHQGRIYSQPHSGGQAQDDWRQYGQNESDGVKKTRSFFQKALRSHVVIEKKGEDGKERTVANVPVPVAAVFAVAAPWLTVASAGLGFATGHTVKIAKEDDSEQKPE